MKTIAVDFDGTIAHYNGWKGKGVFGSPIDGCRVFLLKLRQEGWTIIVNTTRSETSDIHRYLTDYKIPFDHINFSPKTQEQFLSPAKVLADVYLDDRAVRFTGKYDNKLYDKITECEWWRKL